MVVHPRFLPLPCGGLQHLNQQQFVQNSKLAVIEHALFDCNKEQ